MDLAGIKAYWEKAGENFPLNTSVTPTSRDPYLGELERENILSFLHAGFECLEIGCGDAIHTQHYARKVKTIHALDVAGSIVRLAQKRLREQSIQNVFVSAGSLCEVETVFQGHRFDCAISQRCLINLPSWEEQKQAIASIHSLLSDDGILILTESFQENLDNLNSLRRTFRLPEIKVVEYNRNFRREVFESYIGRYFAILQERHYGLYYFLSRVYYPLVVFPDTPLHDSAFNKTAMDVSKALALPELEMYSYNLFYALQKKPPVGQVRS